MRKKCLNWISGITITKQLSGTHRAVFAQVSVHAKLIRIKFFPPGEHGDSVGDIPGASGTRSLQGPGLLHLDSGETWQFKSVRNSSNLFNLLFFPQPLGLFILCVGVLIYNDILIIPLARKVLFSVKKTAKIEEDDERRPLLESNETQVPYVTK